MGYLIDHVGFYFTYAIVGILLFTVTLVCSLLMRGAGPKTQRGKKFYGPQE